MRTTLIACGLRTGLGHVAPLRPVCEGLIQRGRRVVFATSSVELSRQALVDTGAEVVASPELPLADKPPSPTSTFASILYGCGFADPDRLAETVDDWLRLLDAVAPDTVVADHVPTSSSPTTAP